MGPHPADFAERSASIVGEMSVSEKVAILSGRDWWTTVGCERLGVPSVWLSDGPHGLRKSVSSKGSGGGTMAAHPATCFPTAVTLGSSWDVGLCEAVGEAIAAEARAADVAVVLGPGINIKRGPLGGRNFEYFGEDPYHSGALGAAWVHGCQSVDGVGASIKHFAANQQEGDRMFYDARVDERTLREIYFPAFEACLAERPWTVMCAYNRLNGTFCSEHAPLLDALLRREWGFEGLVVSDWWSVRDRVAGVKAGMDLEMPTSHGTRALKLEAALKAGDLDVAAVDACAERVVALSLAALRGGARRPLDAAGHLALAKRAAVGGAVLLKNARGALPLAKGRTLAVIGALATAPRIQGNGSSGVNSAGAESPLDALGAFAAATYAAGYDLDDDRIEATGARADARRAALRAEAAEVARTADRVVVILGLPAVWESECYDRRHLRLPAAQDALVDALAAIRSDLVVVLQNGSPVALPWLERVPAVLDVFLGGVRGAGALADLLFGDANPSGKLAETFPASLEAAPASRTFGRKRQVVYDERLGVGYRHFCAAPENHTLFPFGHGLSYTTFAYANLRVKGRGAAPTAIVAIKNTGDRAGAEVRRPAPEGGSRRLPRTPTPTLVGGPALRGGGVAARRAAPARAQALRQGLPGARRIARRRIRARLPVLRVL